MCSWGLCEIHLSGLGQLSELDSDGVGGIQDDGQISPWDIKKDHGIIYSNAGMKGDLKEFVEVQIIEKLCMDFTFAPK